MGLLRVMCSLGDAQKSWNQQAVLEGNREAIAAVKEAERIFNEKRQQGATAFLVESGKQTKKLHQFDQKAEQIVIVPRVVGG